MGYNDRYWSDREYLSDLAKKHTLQMEKEYSEEIKYSKEKSRVYGMTNNCKKPLGAIINKVVPEIQLVDCDSVSAIFKYSQGRTCVLNFASYLNPGGRFLDGSKAQEECLCHASFLYNVLKFQMDYYRWNKYSKNFSLYYDRAVYSPKITFIQDDKEIMADVLTCAAPNLTAYRKYMNQRFGGFNTPELERRIFEENAKALRARQEFVKLVAEDNLVETLILGAFGCGVFGQDANAVIINWQDIFQVSSIKRVLYAVPSDIDKDNYNIFYNKLRIDQKGKLDG